jgi:phytoene dehydrogenase-like protein
MILVVGGGLAGLRAALTIQESGQQVHVVEATPKAGGRISSEVIDGFTIDRGFQVINPGYSEFQRLDIRTHFHPISAGAVANVGKQSLFFGDPRREVRSLLRSLPRITQAPKPFFGLLRAVLLAKVNNGESADHFLQRIGVTGEIYEALIEPFLRGVFLAPLFEVDARFAQRVLRSLYKQVPGLPDGGVEAVAQELHHRVKSIQTGERVEGITRSGRGFTVKTTHATFSARKVIVATDFAHAKVFSGQLPEVTFARSTAWYFTVESQLPEQHQLHVAALGSGPVVTAIDIAAVVPSYSPDGRGLLSVTTLEKCSENDLRFHLRAIYGEHIDGELITRIEIENALPIIPPGARRGGFLDDDGVIFAGDYLTEPSQNGALLSGRLAGERAINN